MGAIWAESNEGNRSAPDAPGTAENPRGHRGFGNNFEDEISDAEPQELCVYFSRPKALKKALTTSVANSRGMDDVDFFLPTMMYQ